MSIRTRLLLVAAMLIPLAAARAEPPIPDPVDRDRFIQGHGPSERPESQRAIHDEYDVTHYDVTLSLDIPGRVVFGTVEIDAVSNQNGLTACPVDLFSNMTVDAVLANGSPAFYTHVDDVVSVNLGASFDEGDPFSVTVTYHGTPAFPGQPLPFRFMSHAGQPMVLSYSEPFGAPAWWACKDDPKDKATFDIHFTVDDDLTVASNGALVEVEDHGDGTHTFHWSTGYPMSPYLFSIAVTNFDTWTDTYTALDGVTTMPIEYFAYPEDLADAQVSWSNTLDHMDYFVGLFGEYPFLTEKYGIAEFHHPGAMEHQTCTSMGWQWVNGTTSNDWILVHELAHSWVGDLITMDAWSHAWTKEGFATYCEALYFEDLVDTDYYHQYMASLNVLTHADEQLYDIQPVLDGAIYYKGAWVLHMLRHVVGDAAFFQGVRDYVENPDLRYSVGDTEDLRAAFEAASGQDLTVFFDQWVYSPGYPIYYLDWSASPAAGSGTDVSVTIEQGQTLGPIFEMPIDVAIETELGVETFVVQNTEAIQSFELHVAGSSIVSVTLDPDDWIIKETGVVSVGETAGVARPLLAQNRPNPVRTAATRIGFHLEQASRVVLTVFDPSGRQVATLLDELRPPGAGHVDWDATDDRGAALAPGVYYYRLTTDGSSLTRRLVLLR
jgi:aminopeptidase N